MWNGGCNYKMTECLKKRGFSSLMTFHGRTVLFICLPQTEIESLEEWPENKGPHLPPIRPPVPCGCVISNSFSGYFSLHLYVFASFPLSNVKIVMLLYKNTAELLLWWSSATLAFCFITLNFCWNIGCIVHPIFRVLESHLLEIVSHFKHYKNASFDTLFATAQQVVLVEELRPNAPGWFKSSKCNIYHKYYMNNQVLIQPQSKTPV